MGGEFGRGRLRTAPAGAGKFCLVPGVGANCIRPLRGLRILPGTRGVGANCIRPPDGPGRGRMIRRRGTGAHTAARLCKGCMIVSHTVKRPCRCCMVPPHTVKGPCRCCMIVSHTVKGLCRCCTVILHTVKRPCRCCIVILHTVPAPRRCCTLISHTATGCARPARSFFTPCARVSQRILTISTL